MQVHVSFYEDQSGNAGDLYLSEGGVVEIDTTPPSVLGIDAWSSGDDMNFAKAGDVITVTIETSEVVVSGVEVSLEVVDMSDLGQAEQCSLLGLVSCGSVDSLVEVCALECYEGSRAGCRGGMCTRAMTATAEPMTFEYTVESDVWFQGASSVRVSALVDSAGNSGEDAFVATGVSIDVVEPAV